MCYGTHHWFTMHYSYSSKQLLHNTQQVFIYLYIRPFFLLTKIYWISPEHIHFLKSSLFYSTMLVVIKARISLLIDTCNIKITKKCESQYHSIFHRNTCIAIRVPQYWMQTEFWQYLLFRKAIAHWARSRNTRSNYCKVPVFNSSKEL